MRKKATLRENGNILDGNCSPSSDDGRAPLLGQAPNSSWNGPDPVIAPPASEASLTSGSEHLIDIGDTSDSEDLDSPPEESSNQMGILVPPHRNPGMASLLDMPSPDEMNGGRFSINSSIAPATNASECDEFLERYYCWKSDRLWDRFTPAQFVSTGVLTTLGCLATWGLTKHSASVQIAELCAEAASAGIQLKNCA